jgi:predicted Zn-dependent protease
VDLASNVLSDEEVKAVQIMDLALKEDPQSYPLLHVQCDFLRSKGQLPWAIQLAREAVNCAPSEFLTWAKLTEVYIESGEYEAVSTRSTSYLT